WVDRITDAPVGRGWRDRVRAGLTSGLPPPEAELVRALTLGEREGVAELRDLFARAGLAHLLALSGLHLGVIAATVGLALAPLGPSRWLLVAAAAVAFTVWIGPTPSLVRASVMTAAAGVTAAAGAGRPAPWTTLALAAAATLLLRPDWILDLSFQLSYLSLIGIVAFGVPLASRLSGVRPAWHPVAWTGSAIAVSSAATVTALPWVLDAFGEAPAFGPLVNLAALPVATLLVPTGLASGFAGAVWPPLGELGAIVVRPLATVLLAIADAGARLPSVTWGAVAPVGMAYWAIGIAPWAWALRRRWAPWRAAAVSAVALAASLATPSPLPEVELLVLDVGQGDAIVLRLQGRRTVLVDGGGAPFSDFDVGERIVVPALRALGVRALDLVVVSHADADHADGLVAVLRTMPVATLAYGHASPGTPVWDRLEATA
ncbi:MAG: ComEC/Rec2 family competence protein, partial [Trueperaceae bacterium]